MRNLHPLGRRWSPPAGAILAPGLDDLHAPSKGMYHLRYGYSAVPPPTRITGGMMETDAFRIEEDPSRRFVTLRLTRGASGNKLSAEEIPLVGRAIREVGSRKEFKLVLVRADGPNF